MSFRITADSSSNVYALDSADYSFVSLKINCEDREFVDAPGLDIAEMNKFLASTKSRSGTSCPNVQEWLDAFGTAKEVFAVTITSGLSGSCAAARSAAETYMKMNEGSKVCVIDSLSAGPEMHLLLDKIVECDRLGMSFEETEKAVAEYSKRTGLIFSLRSLNNLAKNGRVSVAKAKIAGVLGIRVVGIASDQGTLQPLRNCRGEAKNINGIVATMEETGYCGGRVAIAHCFNDTAVDMLVATLKAKYPDAPVEVYATGGLCSFYAEDGGLMIGYEK